MRKPMLDLDRCPECGNNAYVVRYSVDIRLLANPPHQVERYEVRNNWQCLSFEEHRGDVRVGATDEPLNVRESTRHTRTRSYDPDGPSYPPSDHPEEFVKDWTVFYAAVATVADGLALAANRSKPWYRRRKFQQDMTSQAVRVVVNLINLGLVDA